MRKVFEVVAILVSIVLGVLSCLSIALTLHEKKHSKAAVTENVAAASPLLAKIDLKDFGTNIATDEMTGYFLDLKLSGTSGNFKNKDFYEAGSGMYNVFSRKRINISAILTFTEVFYNELPVFISAALDVTVPSSAKMSFGWDKKVKIFSDLVGNESDPKNGTAIRLPEAYYNLLKDAADKGKNIGKFNVMLVKNGDIGAGLSKPITCEYKLYTQNIPADSDDPNSPNFNLGSIGGLMSSVKKQTGCDIKGVWPTIKIVLICVGVAFGVALVIWLLRMFFGFLGVGK